MAEEQLTDDERFPLMDEVGRAMLKRLRENPAAPKYNYHCGEKLSAVGLEKVRTVATTIKDAPTRWRSGGYPEWLAEYTEFCHREIPFYRERLGENAFDGNMSEFHRIPLLLRDDIRKQPWQFVPDCEDVDELVVYSTSGTTGNFLKVIANPDAPASYLPLMEFAVGQSGVRIEGGARIAILHMAAQKSTYTHCSIMSYFGGAGFAKVNLHVDEWAHPDDRQTFIDDCNAEIYTGDPLAFVELMKLPLSTRPKAILLSATRLLPAVRAQLQQHFECPVIDMISTNETGPIGFSNQDPGDGSGASQHFLFPHNLFVEIVDPAGNVLPVGQRGEIVVTGGVNAMMPLLRYRTGDFAALGFDDDRPYLINFAGRTPVIFVRSDGKTVRSIDVVVKLFKTPLPLFRLHQTSGGELEFETRCDSFIEREVAEKLSELFGDTPLNIEQLADATVWQGKSIQFSSEYKSE